MAEIALTGRAAMRLDIVPEVVIRQLQDAGEEFQDSPVDGLCQVVAEFLDLVHEWVQALGDTVDVLPFARVPVELLDAIGHSTMTLKRASK